MLHRIRDVSRRRMAAALVALLTASAAAPAAVRAVARLPAPQHYYFYADGSYGTLVGEGEMGCDLKYQQWWGTTSIYSESVPLDCDVQK
ncbi:hypothetical protein [Longimicrobium sp.]|uniref:hypothetical protein n=1 Tax=Longimicrobium sp. TaxID=2029185 RepID=UPI002BD47438|nr:hypothetical protein [Longimicrobium sp.]HSU17960.1 hypothetical protein [Longimicrobium sp.]